MSTSGNVARRQGQLPLHDKYGMSIRWQLPLPGKYGTSIWWLTHSSHW